VQTAIKINYESRLWKPRAYSTSIHEEIATNSAYEDTPYENIVSYWKTQIENRYKIANTYIKGDWFGTNSCAVTGTVLQYPYLTESTSSVTSIKYSEIVNGWMNHSIAHWKQSAPAPIPIQDRIKAIIEARQAPAVIISGRRAMALPGDDRETRARQTMRAILGDEDFRLFLKNGFVSVRAKSGRVYQIFPGHEFTRVFENGKPIERLCVVFKGAEAFPPTDSLLMRYLIVLNDEQEFWKLANKQGAYRDTVAAPRAPNVRNLVEIVKELRLAA
jgi:hypothetical protein